MSVAVKKLPGDAYSALIRARFWLVSPQGEGYLGIGRIKLLENIQRYGSINRAAKEMGMSYKKAWKLIEDMNQLAATPLVVSEKGGRAGGGTQITALGLVYIDYFRGLEQRLAVFLQQETVQLQAVLDERADS
ncbi:winged helix-turn-helix domain-containing protein [Thiomicrospira microaerophila]|uniref:winged helix-turn-helix domain-containing protein n=1 Tax=Thiomicrospira microaerophila TaxID=406020 RepID=UPI0005CB24E9|nr:LysR family transcriptional regulator [Thiomicrospira microaerophila]